MFKKYKSLFAIVICLGFLWSGMNGCADTISSSDDEDDSAQSDDKNKNHKTDSKKGHDDDDDDDDDDDYGLIEIGDDTQEEEDYLKTGKCIALDYEACEDDKTRKFCGKDLHFETETCEDACENGKCIKYTNNSCSNPYVVKLKDVVTQYTASGTSYSNAHICSGKIKDTMAVFKLSVPEIGFYKIEMSSDSTTNWGNILASACDPSKELTSSCELQSSTDSFVSMLNAGDHYLFISPASYLAKHFNATVKFTQVSYSSTNLCGQYGGTVNPVAFDNAGKIQVSGSTASGTSVLNWDSNKGCNHYGNGGKENAYIFSTHKKGTLKVTLNVTENADNPGYVAIYMNKCSSGIGGTTGTGTLIQCWDGEPGVMNGVFEDLDIGTYMLFVDSNDGKKSIDYTLSLSLE